MSWLDLNNVEASGDYEPMEEGDYVLTLEEAEIKQTKAGTGEYLKAKFLVEGPTNKGRYVWHNFNTKNPNQKAVEIGLGQLRSLLENSGNGDNLTIQSPSELDGIQVGAKIGVKKSEEYGDQNVVKYFMPVSKIGPVPKKKSLPLKQGQNTSMWDGAQAPQANAQSAGDEIPF